MNILPSVALKNPTPRYTRPITKTRLCATPENHTKQPDIWGTDDVHHVPVSYSFIQDLYKNLPAQKIQENISSEKHIPINTSQDSPANIKVDAELQATYELGLRAVYGAVAGIIFTIIRQNVFGQVPTFDQLYSAGLTCATKAAIMGIANQFAKGQIKKLHECSKFQKDILQATTVSVLESLIGLKQEHSIATQYSPATVFILSVLKSLPSNMMETSINQNLKNHLQKRGISYNLSDPMITSMATMANLVPATLLNTQNFNPENILKTFGLRFVSMDLWKNAMQNAKKTAQTWAENDTIKEK